MTGPTPALMFLTLMGCFGGSESPIIPAGPAQALFAADLDGDGTDLLVHFYDGHLRWDGRTHTVTGSVHAWDVGGPSTTSAETLVIGLGRSRDYPSAKPSLLVIDRDGLTEIDLSSANPSRITDVSIGPEGVLVTILGTAKQAHAYQLIDGVIHKETASIMGLAQVALPDQAGFAIGTLYGPQPRSHGGLTLQTIGNKPRSVQTVRGIRTMMRFDVDGDTIDDLVVADGWHFRYGHEAQALLSVYPGPAYSERIAIGELAASYTINHIIPATVGKNVSLIVLGSHEIARFWRSDLGWRHETIAEADGQTQISLWSSKGSFWEASGQNWLMIAGKTPKAIQILP